jgi:hypothetical protein
MPQQNTLRATLPLQIMFLSSSIPHTPFEINQNLMEPRRREATLYSNHNELERRHGPG